MSLTDEDSELAEEYSERMCGLCETHILGCASMTSHFMCEGRYCDEAIEYLKDDLDNEQFDLREALNKITFKK